MGSSKQTRGTDLQPVQLEGTGWMPPHLSPPQTLEPPRKGEMQDGSLQRWYRLHGRCGRSGTTRRSS